MNENSKTESIRHISCAINYLSEDGEHEGLVDGLNDIISDILFMDEDSSNVQIANNKGDLE